MEILDATERWGDFQYKLELRNGRLWIEPVRKGGRNLIEMRRWYTSKHTGTEVSTPEVIFLRGKDIPELIRILTDLIEHLSLGKVVREEPKDFENYR